METPNTGSLSGWLGKLGMASQDIVRIYRTFNAARPEFEKESIAHEGKKRQG
jgi:hypothetical protein